MENESIKTLLTRRSVRKFKPDHITEEEMETILEAGKYAPTGKGTQCTKFVVIRNKAVRDKLSAMNAEILGSTGDPFYGAPDVIAVFANRAATLTWVEDGSLAKLRGHRLLHPRLCGRRRSRAEAKKRRFRSLCRLTCGTITP